MDGFIDQRLLYPGLVKQGSAVMGPAELVTATAQMEAAQVPRPTVCSKCRYAVMGQCH